MHVYLNRMSFFDDFPALDIVRIPGRPKHLTWTIIRGVPKFDGDPIFAIDHVARFATYALKVDLFITMSS